MSSYSGSVKFPEWRWQRRRADLRHFEIFRHGPIIIYTRLPAGVTYYLICTFLASSEYLIAFLMPFLPFVYGYPSSSPCAHCMPNKSVPALRYTRGHGPIYTGPCPKGSYRVQSPGFPKIVYSSKHWTQNQYSLIERRCFCTSYMYMLFFTASLLFKCCFVT